MSSRTPGRRHLRFNSYEEFLAEVDRLARGHRALGNWDLAQICIHLAGVQDYSIDGTRSSLQWGPLKQATLGRVVRCIMLWWRYIPERQGSLKPPPAPDIDEARRQLADSVRRITTQKMRARHPIFGRLTQAQWHRFHLIHAEHHLSFVVPV